MDTALIVQAIANGLLIGMAPPPQAQFGLAAAGLLPLLADRDRLREAIILTEILRPPLERW